MTGMGAWDVKVTHTQKIKVALKPHFISILDIKCRFILHC